MPEPSKSERSHSTGEDLIARELAAAERRAWLGMVLAQSVRPPLRVILANLERAVASLSQVDPSAPVDGSASRLGANPAFAFRRLGILLDEAIAAAAYLDRMVTDLHMLARARHGSRSATRPQRRAELAR
jgi:hypothetical protein